MQVPDDLFEDGEGTQTSDRLLFLNALLENIKVIFLIYIFTQASQSTARK